MNTLRYHFGCGAVALSLLAFASAQAQPDPSPENCPPPGWAEGLVRYTGATFPFPVDDTADASAPPCAFHMWSWEAFVWATAVDKSTGIARFLTLPTFDDLAATEAVKEKGPGSLYLRPRDNKPKSGRPDDQISGVNQAGSNGIVVDQNGQALFYSSHMNPTYFDFAKKYYGCLNYEKASPTLEFPVGAAVFKASWQIVPTAAAAGGRYTTSARVAELKPDADGGVQVPAKPKFRKVTVALVGLHVVGVTKNHPESLWATFEHVQNAPDLAPGADPKGKEAVSAQGFTFYKANTPAKECNRKALVSFIDEKQQTLKPVTNVFRQYQWGEASKAETQEIDNINAQSQTAMKNIPTQTVFQNYKLIGTVWLEATVPPLTLTPGEKNLRTKAKGSKSLANATMETFVQGSGMNCFLCHNTGGKTGVYPGKNINFSHMLLHPLEKGAAAKKDSK